MHRNNGSDTSWLRNGQVIGAVIAGAILLLLTKVVSAPDLTGGLGTNAVANAGGQALKDLWVFIVAPLCGGALSAVVWSALAPAADEK